MRGENKLRKFLVNIFWVLMLSTLLLVITGILLVNKYEEEIKELSIARINQIIDTQISIEEFDVSFFRSFPYLSLVFHDVTVWSSHNFDRDEFADASTDKLFMAEKVYLKFNAIDLLRSKIRIRRIYAVNGEANILIDSKGRTNARILKPRQIEERKDTKNPRIFELEALRLSDFNLRFNNLSKKTNSSSSIENLMLKGKFSKNEFSLGTQTSMILHNFSRNGIRYANEYDISFRLIVDVKDSLATIQKGELNLNTINMDTRGRIELGKSPALDLMMDSRNINISTLLNSFPSSLREKIPFNAQGRGDLAVKIKGPITSVRVPEIQAVYVLSINQLTFKDENIRDLKLKGKYSNGSLQRPSTTEIDIQKFRISDRNSDFEGSFYVKNLVRPDLSLDLSGEIDAGQISSLLLTDKDFKITGKLYPNIQLRSQFPSFRDIKTKKLAGSGISGEIGLENVDLETYLQPEISKVNGNIEFDGDSWLPKLNFRLNNEELFLNARIDHIMKYIHNKDQVLWIAGRLDGEKLDLGKSRRDREKSDPDNRRAINLPERYTGNISFSFGQANLGKFSASALEGNMIFQNGRYDLSDLSFNSMEGDVKGDAAIVQDKSGNIYLKTSSALESIDIRQLFEAFNNFGQDNLRSDHLEGQLSGNIDFNAIFDNTLGIKRDKIFMESDITIISGELNNFKPMEKLSSFVEIDELRNIRFSALKNTVLIENNKMTIPEMDINSNAFNIIASGIHNFNGNFEYKLKILLSELLSGSAKRKNEEFLVMDDERRASLYLSIAGTAADYKIKYDRKEAMAAIKDDLRKEKTNLKSILNEEFGWFGKDSLNLGKEVADPDFVIEWKKDSVSEASDKKRLIEKMKNRKKSNKSEDEEVFELEWDDE